MGITFNKLLLFLASLTALALACTTTGPAATTPKRLRALCLHGYLSNARMFSTQLSRLVERAGSSTQFVFLDAPHELSLGSVSPTPTRTTTRRSAKKARWFYASQDELGNVCYNGVVESLLLISKAEKEDGPFDVMVGHSQGALMLLLINLLSSQSDVFKQFLESNCSREDVFALPKGEALNVLMSGFLPRDDLFDVLHSHTGVLPQRSLHLFSSEDEVVPMSSSIEALYAYRNAPKASVRPGRDHDPPRDDESIECIIKELEHAWQRKFDADGGKILLDD